MLQNSLLVSSAVVLDIAFFVILLGGTLLGVRRGFVRSLCKIAGWITSLIVAVSFCVAFANTLAGWGLTDALDYSVKNSTISWWLTVAISFVALIVIVRAGAWILGFLGKKIVDSSKKLRMLDRILGGLLGLVKAASIILFLLAVCMWIPSDTMHDFIGSSTIVGAIFNSTWFIETMSHIPFL